MANSSNSTKSGTTNLNGRSYSASVAFVASNAFAHGKHAATRTLASSYNARKIIANGSAIAAQARALGELMALSISQTLRGDVAPKKKNAIVGSAVRINPNKSIDAIIAEMMMDGVKHTIVLHNGLKYDVSVHAEMGFDEEIGSDTNSTICEIDLSSDTDLETKLNALLSNQDSILVRGTEMTVHDIANRAFMSELFPDTDGDVRMSWELDDTGHKLTFTLDIYA